VDLLWEHRTRANEIVDGAAEEMQRRAVDFRFFYGPALSIASA